MDLQEKLDNIDGYRTSIIRIEGEIKKIEFERNTMGTLKVRTDNGFLSLYDGERARLQLCIEGILIDRLADLQVQLTELRLQVKALLA